MPTPPPLPRLASALLAAAAITLTAGCGIVTADRDVVAKDLGLAAGAYAQYVAAPVHAGEVGPSTAANDPALAQAAKAAKYATAALEAARSEAGPDTKLASFAQKTAAAGASLNAITKALESGEANRALVDGGTASIESLLAAARDAGIKAEPRDVSAGDLAKPPVP